MKTRKVVIKKNVEIDLIQLFDYLKTVESHEGSLKYIDSMKSEILSLSYLADIFRPSKIETIRKIHTQARRMISHNRRWNYIFHIESDVVVIDRIMSAKMVK